jgi:hypothetical protein
MKIGFREKEVLLSVPTSGDIRTLQSELTYFTKIVKPQLILVPSGIKTDLGSIPRALQGIFPKDGKAMFAYILHDYLYQTGMFSRLESDSILEEAMETLGVSYWRRKAVKFGLRIGGWVAWNEHRNIRKGKR